MANKVAEKHLVSSVLPGLVMLQCNHVCGAVFIIEVNRD